jgi:hypothetical protein
MKRKTSISQTHQNMTITITTLREQATEMLNVANHLEATQRFVGNGITSVIHARSPGRRLTIVGKRKTGRASTGRTARRKEMPAVARVAA